MNEFQLKNRAGKSTREKRPVKVEHLANWFFGNFCTRCGYIETAKGKECWDKIHLIAQKLKSGGIEEMRHKEFTDLIKRGTTFCKPIKREFHECPICKALGVPQKRR